jgi:hypothetical protein
MKCKFATKTLPYLTREELIDIADEDECWDKRTRAAICRLRRKAKDQQRRELLESYAEEELSGIARSAFIR